MGGYLSCPARQNRDRKSSSETEAFRQNRDRKSSSETEVSPEDVAWQLANKGFTVKQILEFLVRNVQRGAINDETTTSEVVKNIVIPETAKDGTSYMEGDFMCSHGGPKLAERLVSHWWGSPFVVTVWNILLDATGYSRNDLDRLASYGNGRLLRDKRDTKWTYTRCAEVLLKKLSQDILEKSYWLCIFAVNEHKAICGSDWNPCECRTPKPKHGDPDYEIDKFDFVVRHMEALVVSLDPFLTTVERVWVVAEIGEAMQQTPVYFRAAMGISKESEEKLLARRAIAAPLRDCKATDPEDKTMILKKIMQGPGEKAFDSFVEAKIELSLGLCGCLQKLDGEARRALQRQEHLEMDFSWRGNTVHEICDQLHELHRIGDSLSGLKHLQMSFVGCCNVINIGSLDDFLKALTSLQHLKLDFENNFKLSICASLTSGLEQLHQLQHLDINFYQNFALIDIALLIGVVGQLHQLRHLRLSFQDCDSIHESSCASLRDGFERLQNLQHLDLFYPPVGFTTIPNLAHQPQLQHIKLNFHLASPDVSQLKMRHLLQLQHVDLNFWKATITNLNSFGDEIRHLHQLQYFRVNLNDVHQVHKSLRTVWTDAKAFLEAFASVPS